ncbi:tetratricopeptide repeat protein [Aliifodinibius sp. S!AR15-10]|uniref:tetratricopeptide repeat protein n=1 Tax=Aliifodinibius sp. S!AR15-10 TaxID=2950437 RepID=UPI002862DB22|nr:tetratricopeptide repeat protein [Aliifodinibius sp. S!AR15-10]MDR8393714.1 tetratricopeptide repeat protein [Aliifodinibius sp. S!AR15-10]
MAVEHFRLLAAIMFADMVGYTALMQQDEEEAVKKRDRQREILEDAILENQGRVIQYYGDGTLSIFGSAIRSVECAIAIQKKLNSSSEDIPLRIGLHVGDIVYDDEGAYGDAVNLSARIQALAIPGSILVSDRLHDELKNHPNIQTKYLGTHQLKNISRQVAIYAISNKGLAVPSLDEIKSKTGGVIRSVAVLPFVNMSADPENEYFSDGITEEIINALTRVKGLDITSRTSAFVFKGMNKDVRQIGHDLSVRYVLEGSVRKAGNRVRITAQLIDTEDGFHIWSEVFDRDLEDIFKVQDEISRKIAAKLKEDFSDADVGIKQLVDPSTESVQAYNHFLKGNYYLHKWTPESALKAIEQYTKATDYCEEYAEAYAGIANCYSYLGAIGRLSPQKAYSKAESAAQKSIKLNNRLADSHIALAFVRLFYYWDFKGAKNSFRKAMAIDSDSALVKQSYSIYLRIMGKNKAAIRLLKEAQHKDPLSLTINCDLARTYYNAGHLEKALKQFNKVLDLDGNFRAALEGKGWVYVEMGKFEEALAVFQQYQHMVGSETKGFHQLGYLHGVLGETAKAQEYLQRLQKRELAEPDVSLAMDFAIIYLGMGDYDKVFEYLQKAVEEHLGGILFIKSIPFWEPIRSDQRYQELLQKVGMSEEELVSS